MVRYGMKNIGLINILEKFSGKKILIIGDLMVDHYIFGEVNRISPEAPIPIVDVQSYTLKLGGAGNVVNCIIDLGGRPLPVGVVGDDDYGRWITREFKSKGVDEACLLVDKNRSTTTKTRIIARGQHLIRIDYEKRQPINTQLMNQIIAFVKDNIEEIDGVIFSDYEKGLLTRELIKRLIPPLRERKVCIVADPRAGNILHYNGVTIIKTNITYSSKATGISLINETSLRNICLKLLSQLQCEAVVVTQGKNGMSVFERNNRLTHIPATKEVAKDITGAGDVVTATLPLAVASGARVVDAAKLANAAAGVKVTKLGTETVSASELKDWLIKNEEYLS